jgi:hypothetical protein
LLRERSSCEKCKTLQTSQQLCSPTTLHPHHHHHIASHLSYQATDPFSRSPLTIDEVVPDEALAARIRAWEAGGDGGNEGQQ